MADVSPPSVDSANALLRGEPGSLVRAAVHTCGRAILIGGGLAIAGHPQRHLVRHSLAAALVLEAFLLGYAAKRP